MLRFQLSPTMVVILSLTAPGLAPGTASGALIGYLSTAEGDGVIAGGDWAPDEDGFRIDWEVSQNPDGTWHYAYTFSDEDENPLSPATSHIALQLAIDIGPDDVFDFTGDVDEVEFGTFGEHVINPGFPAGESIFGMKIELSGAQERVEFDSTRQPMWADFYAKAGPDSFAYNSDLGVGVANAGDYNNLPVAEPNNPLKKILAPDAMPEPAMFFLLALGWLGLYGRRGGHRY